MFLETRHRCGDKNSSREAFTPQGLDGYIVVANDHEEIAWMHWESLEAMEAALASEAGRAAAAGAGHVLDVVMWTAADSFAGSIDYGQAVNVLFEPQPSQP